MGKKPKIFVPLDYPSAEQAWAMVETLRSLNPCFKVGLELFVAAGPAFVERLVASGAEVFLDLKFHDIPHTVAGAVRSAVRLGVHYLNVHCGGGRAMLEAAVSACNEETAKRSGPRPLLLGVTVLTSVDDLALQEIGFPRSVSAQVKQFVELGRAAGLNGVVCSALELPLVRALAGPSFVTMVPGIRPEGSAADDQKRTMTPQEAAASGADCLVIGRPITGAADPAAALRRLLEQL